MEPIIVGPNFVSKTDITGTFRLIVVMVRDIIKDKKKNEDNANIQTHKYIKFL